MSPFRLNLFPLHVHKQKTDKLDLNLIAKEFIYVNKRRIIFIIVVAIITAFIL